MILDKEVIQIGYISRTHGKQGNLQCHIEQDLLADADPDFIFLRINNILVPFRLVDWREKNSEDYIISLQDIDSEERAAQLVGTPLFLHRDDVSQQNDEAITMRDLIGFSVIDTTKGNIGIIQDIDESTINTLFLLDNGIIIPAHDDFVSDINYETRQLFLQLPDGLLD